MIPLSIAFPIRPTRLLASVGSADHNADLGYFQLSNWPRRPNASVGFRGAKAPVELLMGDGRQLI